MHALCPHQKKGFYVRSFGKLRHCVSSGGAPTPTGKVYQCMPCFDSTYKWIVSYIATIIIMTDPTGLGIKNAGSIVLVATCLQCVRKLAHIHHTILQSTFPVLPYVKYHSNGNDHNHCQTHEDNDANRYPCRKC